MWILHYDTKSGVYEEKPLHITYMDIMYRVVHSMLMKIKEGLSKRKVLALREKLVYKHYYFIYGS